MDDAVKKKVSGEAVAHRHPADYEVWTDGLYIEDTSSVAGAALIFKKGRANCQTVSVGGKGRSSFRSECLALYAGLRRVIADKRLHRGQGLLIATDSQSLLMALKSHAACETTSTSAECVEMLNSLAGRGVKIKLQLCLRTLRCAKKRARRCDFECRPRVHHPLHPLAQRCSEHRQRQNSGRCL
ncbi:Ribonuclease H domain [Perkinsela sp. CCAP 1560/4]|nr:Ribonuclease H domain [Perkinsela sp. CCAP 1560/4]|eukprot:KNH08122.1 Ribonuclease H domain [Perkinsela sp. CCAP 1560/4]